MTPTQGKFLAHQAGCELFWLTEWRVWALKRRTATAIEGSGGQMMSAGTLRALTFDQFTACVLEAKDGPREGGEDV